MRWYYFASPTKAAYLIVLKGLWTPAPPPSGEFERGLHLSSEDFIKT